MKKVLGFLWFILDWRILFGIIAIIVCLSPTHAEVVTGGGWDGSPYYSPALTTNDRIGGVIVAVILILWGALKRIKKIQGRQQAK